MKNSHLSYKDNLNPPSKLLYLYLTIENQIENTMSFFLSLTKFAIIELLCKHDINNISLQLLQPSMYYIIQKVTDSGFDSMN